MEISELTFVERLELFEEAIERQAKAGLISPDQYKEYMENISKWLAEEMDN